MADLRIGSKAGAGAVALVCGLAVGASCARAGAQPARPLPAGAIPSYATALPTSAPPPTPVPVPAAASPTPQPVRPSVARGSSAPASSVPAAPAPSTVPYAGPDLVYAAVNPGGRVVPFDARTNAFLEPIVAPPIPRDDRYVPTAEDFNILADGTFLYVLYSGAGKSLADNTLDAFAIDGATITHKYPPLREQTPSYAFSGAHSDSVHVWETQSNGKDLRLRVYSPDLASIQEFGPLARNGVITDLASPVGDESYVFDGLGTGHVLRKVGPAYQFVGPTISGVFGLEDRVIGTNFPIIAISAAGTTLYVPDRRNVAVVDTTTMRRIASIEIGEPVHGIALSPDNAEMYVLTERFDHQANAIVEKAIAVIDTLTNKIVRRRVIYKNPDPANVTAPYTSGLAVSPDGSELLFATRAEMIVLDAESLAQKASIATPRFPGLGDVGINGLIVPSAVSTGP